jgi:hypothetical protein
MQFLFSTGPAISKKRIDLFCSFGGSLCTPVRSSHHLQLSSTVFCTLRNHVVIIISLLNGITRKGKKEIGTKRASLRSIDRASRWLDRKVFSEPLSRRDESATR